MPENLPPASATVRMYRGILGDCFLLTYDQDGVRTRILIDCGVLQGVAGGLDRIRRIAADVVAEVEGELDLLVLTHEHYDHLSGFAAARDLFFSERLNIKALWLAWTERRGDKGLADDLRSRFKQARVALGLTARLAKRRAFKADESLQLAAGLTRFIGPVEGLAAAGVMTGAQVIEDFQRKVRPEAIAFLEPGQMAWVTPQPKVAEPGAPRPPGAGLRAYVLGPPRDEKKLRKDRPLESAGREVYLAKLDEAYAVASAARAKLAQLGMSAAADDAESDAPDDADTSPFALPHHCAIDDARSLADALMADPATAAEALYDPRVLYYHGPEGEKTFPEPEKRQIEDEWTAAAGALALKMDSDTNNTSLALAFELPDRQILLFPGDAQVGNWLSWHDRTYPADDPTVAPLSANDLLRRVTLYKVGHHASHNATLRELGLERMTDPRLVAMIPVVREVAKKQGRKGGKGWQMPFPSLFERLKEKTKGRVLMGDGVEAEERAAFAANPTDPVSPAALEYAPGPDPLWVQVTITSGASGQAPS